MFTAKVTKFGLFVVLIIAQQFVFAYNIRIEIENCPDYYIFFGKHHGPDFEIIDSIIAKNNIIEFQKDEILETGVYFIVIPPQTRFDFLISDDQNFTIKTDTKDILGKLQITGDKQYQAFVEIQKEIAKINKQRSQLEIELEFFKTYHKDTVKYINKIIDSLNNKQIEIYRDYKKNCDSNKFLYKILTLLEPFQVPDSISALQYSNPSKNYNYYKEHYLDRVDFNESSLLNTPEFVFHKSLSDYCYYFFDVRANKLNEVYPDIDSLISKTINKDEYNQYILSYLISRYEKHADLRLEAILVYLYRNYFMVNKPDWVSTQAYDVMKYKIERIQYNVIGLIGKDLNLVDTAKNPVSIYNIDSEYKVLLFWEPECEICKDFIKQLELKYENNKSDNIQIISICTNNKEINAWKHFITEKKLPWINTIDVTNNTNIEIYYGAHKTPRIYILDKNNKILTKDIKPEHLYDYIISYDNNINANKGNFN